MTKNEPRGIDPKTKLKLIEGIIDRYSGSKLSNALLLAVRLLCHLNYETGRCNPTNEMLAKELGVKPRCIRKLISELREMGIERGAGGNFTFDRSKLMPVYSKAETHEPIMETPAQGPEGVVEVRSEPTAEIIPLKPGVGHDAWMGIRSHYPQSAHGHDWELARGGFDAAVTRDGQDPEFLLEQVRRYAMSVRGKDPKYVMRVENWFARREWRRDYPSPAENVSPLDRSIAEGLMKTKSFQKIYTDRRKS